MRGSIRQILKIGQCIVALSCAQSTEFDPRDATVASTHQALYTGLTDCRNIVSSFLSRIEALNHHTNAIITLDPTALSVAADLDAMLASGNTTNGPLFCIPVLLKENFNTANMPTTGASLALALSQPTVDAPSVTALKNAGAIVIGKTNLHELALEGLSVSSLGGQTINPYDSTRTPGGSSGGTGAAVTASFSVFGTGTDTVNSLRSPASANSLYSCRPTRGLISRAGVIPVSYTQDTIGPIGRCVEDIATVLTVMSSIGHDENDNTTALVPAGIRDSNYMEGLTSGSLKGIRLGLIEGFLNRTASAETTPVNDAMDSMISRLEGAGATIVSITDSIYDAPTLLSTHDVQAFEFREGMDTYLGNPNLGGTHPNTLHELYNQPIPNNNQTDQRNDFLVIPAQYNHIHTALRSSTSNETYTTHQQRIASLSHTLATTFTDHNLTALLYPQQRNLVTKLGSPSQAGRNGILAALTGHPVVTVPMGFSAASAEAPVGVPIGLEILGPKWTEGRLLRVAWAMERELGTVRRSPVWAREEVEVRSYEEMPVLRPARGNVDLGAYPVGRL